MKFASAGTKWVKQTNKEPKKAYEKLNWENHFSLKAHVWLSINMKCVEELKWNFVQTAAHFLHWKVPGINIFVYKISWSDFSILGNFLFAISPLGNCKPLSIFWAFCSRYNEAENWVDENMNSIGWRRRETLYIVGRKGISI